MFIKKMKKYFDFLFTIFIRKISEKSFKYNNEKIKYIFYKNRKSKKIIIVFSACTRKGIKARYNYIRTLKKIKENKLFILDDGGIDQRGTYYLGKYPDFEFEKGCLKLIDEILKINNIEETYLIGSSKGGYSSLYYGLNIPKSRIIIGAPQYFLGTYLSKCYQGVTLKSMNCNEITRIEFLDILLKNKIDNSNNKNKIYIQYSTKDPTYKEHILYLLEDLKKANFCVEEEKLSYSNHNDVSLYFSDYIINILKKNKVLEE